MNDYFYGRARDNYDLSFYHCGQEACARGHDYGPAVRDHYLIHYILSGKGYFKYGEKVYYLKKGQGFLICPETVTYYQADKDDPWHYCWVGFAGRKAEYYLRQANLSQERPIFMYEKDTALGDCILQMTETYASDFWNETMLLSLLYLFLSHLIGGRGPARIGGQVEKRQEYYVQKVVEYIEMNFSRKIRITEIASHAGLDRSYLGALFKEKTRRSLQQYLLEYRINKACELLKSSELSISDISRSVGYDDPLLFSKMFKKTIGVSPKKYNV